MEFGIGLTLILLGVLVVLILITFMSMYSTSMKKTGRKKIVAVNLEVDNCVIHSVKPAIRGTSITIVNPAGKKLRFLIDDTDNPGYRVGQTVQLAYTESGPRLLKNRAQDSHILFQTR